MPTKPIPDGYDSLIPYLVVRNAAKAIEFYQKLFDATQIERMDYPDGSRVVHAELKIRGHVLMLGDENPQMNILSPQSLNGPPPCSVFIYVPDVDRVFAKAVELGSKAVMPPTEMFWGDRYGKFVDPFGHHWAVATRVKELSKEEMARGAAEFFKRRQA